jgi:hypothetical protein
MNCSHITLLFNVQRQDVVNFFGHELGSIDHLDSNLFSSTDTTIAVDFSKKTYRFLAYLDLASRANAGQECAIDDLAKSVLEVTGFDQIGTILRTRYDIPFTICGDSHQAARSDVCLVHLNSMILLVVQEDKTAFSSSDPEPQIVAEAIATFQHNNRKRADLDLPQLDTMTIPCITMVGTRPFFFTKSQLPSSSATVSLLVNFLLSRQSLDDVLRPPDEGPSKAWKSQIIGASPYSTTMHSVVWRKIAGLRTLMAGTKVCSLVMKELNLIKR